jgi:hypothetical protein
MEPVNLSPSAPDDERLEAVLRQPTAGPLPDDGFSTQVLAALPPPRREGALGWRGWLVAGLVACRLLAFGPDLSADFDNLGTGPGGALASLVTALDRPDRLLGLAVIVAVLVLTADDGSEADQAD